VAHWLEQLYPYAPLWVQNAGISLYGLAYRRERLGGAFAQYVEAFSGRNSWSRDQMDAYVRDELRRMLLHAFDNVAYYRRRWTAAGIQRHDLARLPLSDLPRIPVTSKEDLRRSPEDFVAANVAPAGRLLRYHSSGSTGTPITVMCTADSHRKFRAGREVRSFGWAGASVRMPRSTLGGRMIVPSGDAPPPYYRYNWAERQVYLSAYHISPHSIDGYIEAFNRYRPALLTGYAHAHYLLARMMCERGLRLDYEPRAIVLSSEKLTAEMKSVIRTALRARAYEEYGAVEDCMLATECPHGSLHVSPDFGVIEIVDDDGRPVPPGVEGRVVCTGLLNDAQPLIRYAIGDVASWSPTPCSCGVNQFPVLQEVVGRLEDVVVGLDGREMNRFHGIFINMPHVVEAQIVQESRRCIRVNLVPTSDFNQDDEALIRHRIATERLPGMEVEVCKVRALERTERGKFRAVISRLSKTPQETEGVSSNAHR
jgi:phenylacetate-CoA ligase